jgi:hypothetical protein
MSLRWTKRFIAGEAFESAAFVDVDGDGVLDIVSGAFWYRGPDFEHRRTLAHVPRFGDYYDDFGSVAVDLTGDGSPDIVTGGWWGQALRWRRNPGADHVSDQPWAETVIAEVGSIEQPRAWDVDGDGRLELVPNTPGAPLVVHSFEPGDPPTWKARTIWGGAQGHGLGFGDISGSGRGDFVMNHGWLEAPEHPDDEWILHSEFDLGPTASVPIIVADVDGDGLSDLIVGNGHGYGLDWWRQGRDASGARTWTRQEIDPAVSQCHTLHWADIDGDGRPELVTGKRWRAHPVGDAGNEDDLGIWYYTWDGEAFRKHVIDAGPAGFGSGAGIDFDLADVTGNGYPDLIAPGKDGLWLFLNEGPDRE